jgi:hypothetical protein
VLERQVLERMISDRVQLQLQRVALLRRGSNVALCLLHCCAASLGLCICGISSLDCCVTLLRDGAKHFHQLRR